MKRIILIILFLQISVVNAESFNPQHIVWDHVPIDVVLPIGKERILTFPRKAQFGYDRGVLTSDVLQVQNNDGALYLVANKSFAPQRIEVKLIKSGKVILLNLSAQDNASDVPLSIVMPCKQNDLEKMTFSVDYPSLLRFAVQQLYAPERLLTKPSYIYRVPMHASRTVSLFTDNNVVAMPQISWRGGDLYITAVILRNLSQHSVYLKPKKINGNWVAVSFFPLRKLSHKGALIHGIPKDNTTVFLISKKPFSEAIGDV